jgi:hypothetical protein
VRARRKIKAAQQARNRSRIPESSPSSDYGER